MGGCCSRGDDPIEAVNEESESEEIERTSEEHIGVIAAIVEASTSANQKSDMEPSRQNKKKFERTWSSFIGL